MTELFSRRLILVTGHYGTGKTEFSVNLALEMKKRFDNVTLADLDIVNPYFRSREKKTLLQEQGIRFIASSQACTDADIPALPAELQGLFEDRSRRGILDVGGDCSGARVLARFRPRLAMEDHHLLFVLNANRPEVRKKEDAIGYLRSIEEVTGLCCTGIVNNTHLCGETSPEDVRSGAVLAAAVSRETGIPVLCHTANRRFAGELLDLPVFPIDIYMKKPWE